MCSRGKHYRDRDRSGKNTAGIDAIEPFHLYVYDPCLRERAKSCDRVVLVLAGDVSASECYQDQIIRSFVESFKGTAPELVVIFALGNHDEAETRILESIVHHGGYSPHITAGGEIKDVALVAEEQAVALSKAMMNVPDFADLVNRTPIAHWSYRRMSDSFVSDVFIVIASCDVMKIAPDRCVVVATPFPFKYEQQVLWDRLIDNEKYWRNPRSIPPSSTPTLQKAEINPQFTFPHTSQQYPAGHRLLDLTPCVPAGVTVDALVTHDNWDRVVELRRELVPTLHIFGHRHDGACDMTTDGSTLMMNAGISKDTDYGGSALSFTVAPFIRGKQSDSFRSDMQSIFPHRFYVTVTDEGRESSSTFKDHRPCHGVALWSPSPVPSFLPGLYKQISENLPPEPCATDVARAACALDAEEIRAQFGISPGTPLCSPLIHFAQALYDGREFDDILPSRASRGGPRRHKRKHSKNNTSQLKLDELGGASAPAWRRQRQRDRELKQKFADADLRSGGSDDAERLHAECLWNWFRKLDMQQVTHCGGDIVDWEPLKLLARHKVTFLSDPEAIERVEILRLQICGFTGSAPRSAAAKRT